MIIRQFAVRHGRSALGSSLRAYAGRTYATNLTQEHRALRPSTNDHVPERTIPGHPSDQSSILDQSHLPPTRASREAAERLGDIVHETSGVEGDLNAFIAAREHMTSTESFTEITSEQPEIDSRSNTDRLNTFYDGRRQTQNLSALGSKLVNVYEPWELIRNPPKIEDVTLPMLLANQTHLGHATSLWNPGNSSYIFGIRDGIHIISLEITLAYLRRATKVIYEVAKRGGIIVFVGTRKGQRELVLNTASMAEGYHLFDRWVPGILTNGQQILENCAIKVVDSLDKEVKGYRDKLRNTNHPVLKPDLVVCLNTIENRVCLHECGTHTIPTIGVIDTDCDPTQVTYPIPANDDSLRSIALIAGVLGRAAQAGQHERRVAARRGELTYSVDRVQSLLDRMKELAEMDVQDKETDTDSGKKGKNMDTDA